METTVCEPELQEALETFDHILLQSPDHYHSYFAYKNFLRNFLRVRTNQVNLPASQVMAILKHEKPKVFHLLKSHSKGEPGLHFLTHINLDYETAQKQLKDVRKQIQMDRM